MKPTKEQLIENKPKVNKVATIVNSMFLDSPYEGKDWEQVRKDLIDALTTIQQETEKSMVEKMKGETFRLYQVNAPSAFYDSLDLMNEFINSLTQEKEGK